MPTIKIPINVKYYSNIDGMENTNTSPMMIDCFNNENGSIRKRPGLVEFTFTAGVGTAIGDRIDGLYWWDDKAMLIVVTQGRIHKIYKSAGVYYQTELSAAGSRLDDSTNAVSFATDGTYLFMANGGLIVYTDGTAATATVTGANVPTDTSFVIYANKTLIALELGTNRFRWSGVGTPLTWTDATKYASADMKSDKIVALGFHHEELVVFGEKSIELWYYDATDEWTVKIGGTVERGCFAKYSVVNLNSAWYWLDENLQVVRMSAGSRIPQVISTPIASELMELTRPDLASAFPVIIKGQYFYVLKFRYDDRTFVYNTLTESWHRWGYWSTSEAEHDDWLGNCYAYSDDWMIHFVGDKTTSSGKIFKMDFDYHQDDGRTIVSVFRTGHLDHGTFNEKVCNLLRLRLKHGDGSNATEDQVGVRFNDDNAGFKNYVYGNLGYLGDNNMIMTLFQMGRYRTRQYEFRHSGNADFVLVDAESDVEVLDR